MALKALSRAIRLGTPDLEAKRVYFASQTLDNRLPKPRIAKLQELRYSISWTGLEVKKQLAGSVWEEHDDLLFVRRRVQGWSYSYTFIFVPSTSRNFASHSGWAGQAGAVTKLPSTCASLTATSTNFAPAFTTSGPTAG